MMTLTPEDIQVIGRLVDDLCGIVLDESKGYLIESRLGSVAREGGCASFAELYHKVRYENDRELERKIIDAITTNETLFFRDATPFEALKHKAIPESIDARAKLGHPKTLRVWSAACSTGQEPYSIGMVLTDLIPDIQNWDISILATDISDAALEQASKGRYVDHEIQRGMTDDRLNRYFKREENEWVVSEKIRSLVTFRRINLTEPFPRAEPFDIIFCRNVAIYFSEEVQNDLFNRLADSLTPTGYLFVGASESLNRFGARFQAQHHCRAVFYQPNTHLGESKAA